jgi:hypothetical protein
MNRDFDGIALEMNAFDHFHHTVRMLNESMNMCIP